MKLQVGVKIILKNPRGKYLLIHRSAKKYPEVNNLWDIPGGRIKPGSVLMDNLKREVKEETKLKITSEPKLIGAQDILKLPSQHIVRLTYLGTTTGEPVLDTDENDNYRWVTLEEFKSTQHLDHYVSELLEQGVVKKG